MILHILQVSPVRDLFSSFIISSAEVLISSFILLSAISIMPRLSDKYSDTAAGVIPNFLAVSL